MTLLRSDLGLYPPARAARPARGFHADDVVPASMPAHWLVKSEPDVFSFDDLKKAPKKTTDWTNVRNFRARNNLRAMKVGDLAFYYHSNADPSAIVGIVEVVREHYPDPTQFDAKKGEDMGYDPKATKEKPVWSCVDVRYVEDLPRPVPLDEVKATPALAEMQLVRISRLSVQEVSSAEWKAVLALARKAPPKVSSKATTQAARARRG